MSATPTTFMTPVVIGVPIPSQRLDPVPSLTIERCIWCSVVLVMSSMLLTPKQRETAVLPGSGQPEPAFRYEVALRGGR